MTILFAAEGWDPAPWIQAFGKHSEGRRPVKSVGQDFDPASIHYAAVWKPRPGLLASLPNLRAIFNLGAGVDALLADTTLPDVPIIRIVNPDLTVRMTEWIVLQALFHLRQMPAYQAQQARREWRQLAQPAAREVRVGLMGYGVLGRDSADVLQRLGFNVAVWARRPQPEADCPVFIGKDALPAFLARTDMLVVLLPLTPDTRGILDRRLFAGLARDGVLGGPVLINAGRGLLQVEADILAALESGLLAGASLDVFETEPLPVTSPLWTHPKIVITPHVAADSTPEGLAGGILADIARFERGETLPNEVDRRAGY
ncbi:MAG: glyoxylate/hydroxypyruvate reductase A [Beijerinckiaceae bacterium]|nr:glyoxylate/hydroxypyruvate reductase A [Beijerinckiaceae bacterium]MCZ8300531.1 glyoxylate/hydroxypyruvate reductase A [Beijerinckiaceae bacterium]